MYNTQGDFSLLSMGKTQVHVYNMHRLLLKSFQWQANGLHRFDEHAPPLIPESVSFAWVVQVSWLMRRQSGYYATWVGQRRGCRPGNKTLLWVIPGCDEYSFDVSQVGDVNT